MFARLSCPGSSSPDLLNGKPIKHGELLGVQWPDGTVTHHLAVVNARVTIEYLLHGTVVSIRLYDARVKVCRIKKESQ